MNQEIRLMVRFLVENLAFSREPITPHVLDHSAVWDQDTELWEIWDLLHWSTQEQICAEVASTFAECCLD